jgi:hypothetical protein
MEPLWAIFGVLVLFLCLGVWLSMLLWLQLTRMQKRQLDLTELFASQIVAFKFGDAGALPSPTVPDQYPRGMDFEDPERHVGSGSIT